jgi:hypothetical protein
MKQTTGDQVFIIELHANAKRIERAPKQLRKEF